MTSWTLQPLLGSWWIVLLVAAALIGSLWISPQFQQASRGRRRVLTLLRLIAVLLLVLASLRPGLVWRQEKSQAATVAVLIDYSASQQLPSGQGDLTRWAVEQRVWQQIAKRPLRAPDKLQIKAFGYDSRLRELVTDDKGKIEFPKQPAGATTDLGQAITDLLSMNIDPPLTAVMLIGDGTQTVVDSKLDPIQIARQLGQLDQPLIALGVGPRGDSEDSRDISVEGLPTELVAFTKNEIGLTASVRMKGFAGKAFPLKVSVLDSDGKSILNTSIPVQATEGDQLIPVQVPMVAPDPGQYRLVAEVDVQGGELVASNNSATSFLTVRSGGVRVLYLEGQPRQEQLFVRRAIRDSRDIQLDFLFIPQSSRSTWPKLLPKVFDKGSYDAFILGDLDSSALGDEQLQQLRDRISEGAGLILLGGFHAYDGGGYGGTPLADVMPVELRAGLRQAFDRPVMQQLQWEGPLQVSLRGSHPITMLDEESKNVDLWSRLRPLDGANRWLRVKNVPGVQVIANGPKGEELLVTGGFDKGRVLAIAGDSTWRWWMQGEEKAFKRFWRQSLLWVLGKDRLDPGMTLRMTSRRLFRDQKVGFSVIWDGGTENSPLPADAKIRLKTPQGNQVDLTASKLNDTQLDGNWIAEGPPGLYELQASATGSNGQPIQATLPFLVIDNSLELANPSPDWSLLTQMAQQTEAAGGKLINIEEVDQVFEMLNKRWKSTVTEVEQHRRLGDQAADGWMFLVFFAIVLGTEWFLRKRWQFV